MSDDMLLEKFLEQYGNQNVTFENYYKYSFLFSNDEIWVSVGGNAGDIYKFEISREPVTVNYLHLDMGINLWGEVNK